VFASRLQVASSQLEESAKVGQSKQASKLASTWYLVVDELVELLDSASIGKLCEAPVLALRAPSPTNTSSSSVLSSEPPASVAPTNKGLSHALKEVQAAKAALRNSFQAQMRHLEGIEAALSGEDANLPFGRVEVAPPTSSQPLGASASATSSLEPTQVLHTSVLDLDHMQEVPRAVIQNLLYKYFNTPKGLAATLKSLQQAVDANADADTMHNIFHKFTGEAKYVGARRLEARLLRMDREPAELATEGMAELLALIEEAKQALRARGLLVDT